MKDHRAIREVLIAATVCALLAFAMFGCAASTRITGPQSHASVTREVTAPDGTKHVTREEITAQGPSGSSSGDKEQLKLEGTAPTAQTPGGLSVGGGSLVGSGSASILQSGAARVITGAVGVLLILAGGYGAYRLQPIRATAGTVAIGVGLLLCAVFPAWAMYALLAVALASAASLWLSGDHAAANREALRAVVAGVADYTSSTTKPDILEAIATHATAKDKAVIRQVKKADDLP